MHKKTIAMVTSLFVGGTLLAGTAYVNASQLSGYEAYKAAVMDTKNVNNGTAAVTVSVTDNGTKLIDVSSNVKANLAANAFSSVTSLNAGSTAEKFESYAQDGKNISYNSLKNEYTVMGNKRMKLDKVDKINNPQLEKSIGVVIDTLVGSMKDGVSAVDNGDGTKKVTIRLGENDVTPLVNAVASMAFIGANEVPRHNEKADINNLKNVISQLQSDIKVVSINSDADIDKNDVVMNQTAEVVLSGKDAQGASHEVIINVDMKLSNINDTIPDKADLTGKQVKTITANTREGHNN